MHTNVPLMLYAVKPRRTSRRYRVL